MSGLQQKEYNSETIFPWKMLEKIVATLNENNADYKTYSECKVSKTFLPDPYKYLREYSLFKLNQENIISTVLASSAFFLKEKNLGIVSKIATKILKSNSKKAPQVFFQHDADRQPYKTTEMMQRERKLGIRSSSFFFYERNMWDDDKEPYIIDVEKLKELEQSGFEIGYHLNAFELAEYNEAKAFEIIDRDVAFFKKHFKLRGFVPHGGVAGENGVNNDFIPNKGILKSLTWYYNGRSKRGFLKDKIWSDGNIYFSNVNDPIQIAKNLKQGERLLYLMHPQYYGDSLMKNWEQLPVSKEKWWRELWGL